MHFLLTLAPWAGLSLLSTVVSAGPFGFPLNNSFPNVDNPSDDLTALEMTAQGSLPDGLPPVGLSEDTFTSLRLIAFNELAEVAFFTQLMANITDQIDGYNVFDDVDAILAILGVIQAQEELHLLNANGALAHFNEGPIQPCKYSFPVESFGDAIALASTFTDVVLGTLPDIQTRAAIAGDIGLIKGVGSVLGQEGEQDGFYRVLRGLAPSALPFLTASTREFAFSAINQAFVVPGTCPNAESISIPIFAPLGIEVEVDNNTSSIPFSLAAGVNDTVSSFADKSIVYINQQNVPVVEMLVNITVMGGIATFSASFPYNGTTFGNGLTLVALVNGSGPFADATAVANATVAGPGLIEIN